jgi:lysyl-tRNA synthetase, class II
VSGDDENFLIAERRRKLDALRAAGPAFPNDYRRDALAGELQARYGTLTEAALEEAGVQVKLAGRMTAKRLMGKAAFIVLQDPSGSMQIYVQRDALARANYDAFKEWDLGDIVAAEGALFRTRSGELTVRARDLRLLVKALRPLPEKYHGLADRETRYRQRYVDLIVNERARAVFQLRTQLLRLLREMLDARGFMEVETPMMQPIPGGALARPFVTHHQALDMDLYLRIAPELYLKRLVVGGFERVYEINRNFRNEGLSTQHNPEFTMLELYQAYADCDDIMALTETLIRGAAERLLPSSRVSYQGVEYDLGAAFERASIEELIMRYNPQLERARLRDSSYLRALCRQLGIATEPAHGAGKLQLAIYEKTAESQLHGPVFVTSYPTEVSPLARCNDADPFVTDRFELIIGGRELANGFSELNDPEDQAQRFKAQAAAKAAGDDEAMYYDADYVRALEYGLPPSGGLGVGIDRLVMLFTDAPSIRDVLLFPLLRREEP